ncbi:hypothetical protein Q0Z83_060340 [Actinoplanes sichuanensis]|uniref:Uncharacterized protein n=1 Tax=Actinoplanes sichuanensis TaxID=512349 RepID=A0ABW4A7A0_9ACTN|nr:hypothetical protein [Actinoplanes sichuanensis]BEL07843.1 hypothetical protein Q0Z83_060340 [Actinoplanes sichuanensis]
MTSHRAPETLWAYIGGWIIDGLIGLFIGITLALLGLLATLWVMALSGHAW